jgi:hypothetical protein
MLVVRLAEGLVLAVLLPLCFSRIRHSDAATGGLALVYGVFTILPVYDRWQAWVAALMSALCAPAVRRRVVPRPAPRLQGSGAGAAETEAESEAEERPAPSLRERAAGMLRKAAVAPLPLLAAPAIFGAATLGGGGLWRTLWRSLTNDHLAVTVDGAVASVFVGGLATGLILRRFSSVTAGRAQAVLGAGTLLGWLERTLYFAFLLAGQPTAAAFALTAKSAARFPALQRDEEGLAEYYLIGSLSSLVIAVVTALLTRLALGMPAV